MSFLNHSGSYSSNGIKTTTQTNTVIIFEHPVNSLELINEGTVDMTVKLNSESNYHLIKVGEIFKIEDIRIDKITIVENSAMYSYGALYY